MRPLVEFAAEPACAQDVPRALAHAVFEAQLQRRPTYLSVPYDDWDTEAGDNVRAVLDRRVRRGSVPDADQERWLVEQVRTARRPALVLGGDIDAAGAVDDAIALAERLGSPVWAAPSMFRLPFPNRHPLFRGVLPAGIAPISDALTGHDLVLVLGAPVFRCSGTTSTFRVPIYPPAPGWSRCPTTVRPWRGHRWARRWWPTPAR